jgi:hypothetical protein
MRTANCVHFNTEKFVHSRTKNNEARCENTLIFSRYQSERSKLAALVQKVVVAFTNVVFSPSYIFHLSDLVAFLPEGIVETCGTHTMLGQLQTVNQSLYTHTVEPGACLVSVEVW